MKLKKWEEKIKRKDLRCKTNRYTHDFQHFKTTRSYTGKITIDEAEMDQSNLLENIVKFNTLDQG